MKGPGRRPGRNKGRALRFRPDQDLCISHIKKEDPYGILLFFAFKPDVTGLPELSKNYRGSRISCTPTPAAETMTFAAIQSGDESGGNMFPSSYGKTGRSCWKK